MAGTMMQRRTLNNEKILSEPVMKPVSSQIPAGACTNYTVPSYG